MKRINSKAALIKHRVGVIHGRAKFVGVLYFLGTIAITVLAMLSTMIDGTVLAVAKKFPAFNVPAKSFYKPIVRLIRNLNALTADIVLDAMVGALYAVLVLTLVINVFKALSKLGWLFKRRASYTNGFNRNMYAMDDLAKCFSSSFSAVIILYLQAYLLTANAETDLSVNMVGYLTLALGLVIHLLCGVVGGTVTLFTTADNMEEEPREFGVFVFFVRNLVQIVATAVILYFLTPQSALNDGLKEVIYHVVEEKNTAWLKENVKLLIPLVVEFLAWICIFVLVKHSVSDTEFNRDCLDGAGMKNFTVFSLFTALFVVALIALPTLKIGAELEQEKMMALMITAAVAFVAFLFNCIVKPRHRGDYDDVDMEAYFRGGNIII